MPTLCTRVARREITSTSIVSALPPVVGRTALSKGVRRGCNATVKVSSPLRVFTKSSRQSYSSKRGAIRGPQAQYSSGGGPPEGNKKLGTADIVTIGGLLLTTVVGTVAIVYGSEEVQDLIYGDGLGGYSEGPSFGDITGAALWAGSLYFASPLQLLLLFLGRIDTDRPSDWVLKALGRGAGYDVDALSYEAPVAVRAATVSLFAVSGCATAWFFSWAFGDATWAVSTGLGACIAAAVYELGRPERLSVEEAEALEEQWQAFARWADERLERSGRCHFTEVNSAFRSEPGNGRFRTEETLGDTQIRNMIANWAPEATRSSAGYYKGLSVKPRADPFKA
eukprot:CAMPEP_0118921680 /NCGR_PEP_ID=MMETSP1169-20130426/879_1 /TAXON_ID=36882 /ORGANISM="Pyramimonas obovata, Strain CCMP722" /LENGTH=337 /DNA_ID=CAMNT_0006862443 /DNA_START=168 /DNA_END=1181 /DNA_ORIENTATION=+